MKKKALSVPKLSGFEEVGKSDVSDASDKKAPAGFLEYLFSGAKWRVDRWEALRERFEISAEEMTGLHEGMQAEGRLWRILRLLYGIAPLLGETDVEYLQEHSHSEVAAKFGVTDDHLDAELAEAVAYWKRLRMARRSEESAPSRETQIAAAMPADDVKQLLRAHNLDDLKADADRRYAAQRVLDLEQKLDDAQGRPLAIRAIRMELQLQMYDVMIASINEDIENADLKTRPGLREALMKASKAQSDLNSEYGATLERLDATQAQNPGIKQKAAFVDCLSVLIEAQREYYARGDRKLIDGVFRAAEIELLVKPASLRPPQYRPDLVAVIADAMKEENLFNPSYESPEMPRAAYRRFRKAFAAGLQAIEDGEEIVDLEDDYEAPASSEKVDVSDAPDRADGSDRQSAALPPAPVNTRAGDEIVT